MTDYMGLVVDAIESVFPKVPVYYLDPPYEDSPSPYIRVAPADQTDKSLKNASRGSIYMTVYYWDARQDHQQQVMDAMQDMLEAIEKAVENVGGLLYRARKTITYDLTTATVWLRGGLEIYIKYVE